MLCDEINEIYMKTEKYIYSKRALQAIDNQLCVRVT